MVRPARTRRLAMSLQTQRQLHSTASAGSATESPAAPLHRYVLSLLTTVQLTRAANAFAAVANLWFVVLWTHSVETEAVNPAIAGRPVWIFLLLGAVIGIGLSAYGGALNDVFDARLDQAFAPDRPIPSGRISPQSAVIIGVSSLLLAMLAAMIAVGFIGVSSFFMCIACAAAILFFNALAKHIPSLRLLTIAVIHGSLMLTLSFGLRFIWPILLVMVHAVGVHAAIAWLEDKRPRATFLTVVAVVVGFGMLAIALYTQTGHEGPLWEPNYRLHGLLWPAAAVLLFIVMVANKVRFASNRALAGEKLERYGSLWMGIYGLAWLLGGGLYIPAIWLGALVTLGILWMMFVRDLGAWIDEPAGYRW